MEKAEVVRWLRNPKRKIAEIQKIVDTLNLTVEPGGNLPTRKSRAVKALLEDLPADQVSLPDEVIALIALDAVLAEHTPPPDVRVGEEVLSPLQDLQRKERDAKSDWLEARGALRKAEEEEKKKAPPKPSFSERLSNMWDALTK